MKGKSRVLPGSTKSINHSRLTTFGVVGTSSAEICVVVISLHSDVRSVRAVRSVLSQSVETEIVVVNSGSGSLAPALQDMLDRICLVECEQPLLPGGARNLGIKHSKARIVAFLACDCMASENWLEQRVLAHKSGNMTVSSLVRPMPGIDGSVADSSWASYWASHFRRMPETPEFAALRYSLSYDRSIFEKLGLFREDLLKGEDTQFNQLVLQRYAKPFRSNDIVILHDYPQTAWSAITDMFTRARAGGKYQLEESGVPILLLGAKVTVRVFVDRRHLKKWLRNAGFRYSQRSMLIHLVLAWTRIAGVWSLLFRS